MPSKIDPSSKYGLIRIQEARRKGQRQSASTGGTIATQSRTTQSPQHHTNTPPTVPRQAGQLEDQESAERKRVLDAQNKEIKCKALIYIHLAMRQGLLGFTGTTLEPPPDPSTGSYAQTLDEGLKTKLIDEIRADAHKLFDATYAEKEVMVRIYDSAPRRVHPFALNIIGWAQAQRPVLYKEYVETAFNEFKRTCNTTYTGKERDREETMKAVNDMINKIKKSFDEAQYREKMATSRK